MTENKENISQIQNLKNTIHKNKNQFSSSRLDRSKSKPKNKKNVVIGDNTDLSKKKLAVHQRNQTYSQESIVSFQNIF